jgi:acetyltransferase-like isoleucine patch superfamily enzyme
MARRLILLFATILPSALRVRLWRRMGFSIGRNCRISILSVIVADDIRLGNDVHIYPLAVIYNLRQFHVGAGTIISYFGLIYSGGGLASFTAGERFALGMLAMIDATAGVTAGDFCAIGPRSILYTHANAFPTSHGYRNRYESIRLGDRVWLMLDVKVMPGVSIASDVHVMPSALVARSIKKPGIFLNAYMAQKDIVSPAPAMFRQVPDEAFVDQWFADLFSGFEAFVLAHYKRRVTANGSSGEWIISDGVRKLLVKDCRRHSQQPSSNFPALCLVYDKADPIEPTAGMKSWINCNTLNYSNCTTLPFWTIIWHYFFVQHGIALAEVDGPLS